MAQVERGLLRYENPTEFAVDASEAGLGVGEWPMVVKVPDRFGALLPFELLNIVRDADGDVRWACYTYRPGMVTYKLRVYND